MTRHSFEDEYYRTNWYTDEEGGEKVVKNERGTVLGYYDEGSEIARNAYGRIVEYDNLVAAFSNLDW